MNFLDQLNQVIPLVIVKIKLCVLKSNVLQEIENGRNCVM